MLPLSFLGLTIIFPVIIIAYFLYFISFSTKFLSSLIQPKYTNWREIIRYDAKIGWRVKPNLNTSCEGQDVFSFTTDQEGWRINTDIINADTIVLGDSFAFGFGVDDDRFFASLPMAKRVKAIGAPGYNMVQEYLILEDIAHKLREKKVVWLIYLGNDLYENIQPNMMSYRAPFVVQDIDSIWNIEVGHLQEAEWPYNYHEHIMTTQFRMIADISCPSHFSERAFSACSYLIKKMQILCTTNNISLTIFTVPDQLQLTESGERLLRSHASNPDLFDLGYADRQIQAICDSATVEFVPLRRHLSSSDYFEADKHWNQFGHNKFSKLLDTLV